MRRARASDRVTDRSNLWAASYASLLRLARYMGLRMPKHTNALHARPCWECKRDVVEAITRACQ